MLYQAGQASASGSLFNYYTTKIITELAHVK
jgi:hypothetical protein